MRTIYLDENYICHVENAHGRTVVETDLLDFVTDAGLPCYKFIPAHDGKVDFIQCVNSEADSMVRRQQNDDNEIINIITGEVSINDKS